MSLCSEPKGALCLSTVTPQNEAGHGGGGTVSIQAGRGTAQRLQGVTVERARTWAEKESLNSVSCSVHSLAFLFPLSYYVSNLEGGLGWGCVYVLWGYWRCRKIEKGGRKV